MWTFATRADHLSSTRTWIFSRVDYDLLYRHFTRSLDAVNEGPVEDFDLFIANSVLWVCILDEALSRGLGEPYTAARDADPDGRVLGPLRLARNAITHGQAFALDDGRPWPEVAPNVVHPRVWKFYGWLIEDGWNPPGARSEKHRKLAEIYDEEIAGTNIGSPLWRVREWLEGLAARGWAA